MTQYRATLLAVTSALYGSQYLTKYHRSTHFNLQHHLFIHIPIYFGSSFNPLNPSGYIMCQQAEHIKIQRSAPTAYVSVLYGYQKKQRVFPHTAFSDWFL